jgi:hypothetical protein
MTVRHPFAVLILAALVGAAGPAAADWLVTTEGAKVETQGVWTVKGKLVVFKTTDGKLSSLRLSDVDLDASRNATEEAVAASAQAGAEPEKPVERKKSVRVITDKDVRQAPPPGSPGAAGTADGQTGAATGPGVVIDTWKQDRDSEDGHVVINGSLQNSSGATATELQLKVMLYDESNTLIATSQAALGAAALPPGEKITFRADFPDYFSFATLKFEPTSKRLVTRAPNQPIPPPPPAEPGNGG